jgi:rare lipoprotein A
MIVRVNDRGPYHGNRIMDVSERVAEALSFKHNGTARVRVEYLGRAALAGSDDTKLLATLRTDGMPAIHPGQRATMVADAGSVGPGPLQRQALAFKDTLPPRPDYPVEPDEQAEAAPARRPGPAPIVVASLVPPPAMEPRAAGVPLPPERPFDLGTIPNAATPVPGPVARGLPPDAADLRRAVLRRARRRACTRREGGPVQGLGAAALCPLQAFRGALISPV